MVAVATVRDTARSAGISPESPRRRAFAPSSFGPYLVVGITVAWGLFELRSELTASLPRRQLRARADGAVRAARLRAGHLPLTSWFPYLGLGSPQFLHYQSLPAMIAGALGIAGRTGRRLSGGRCTCSCRCGRSASTVARLFGLRRRPPPRRRPPVPFLVELRSGSGTSPRRMSGSASACGPSCGRRGRCRWRGRSRGGPCPHGAPHPGAVVCIALDHGAALRDGVSRRHPAGPLPFLVPSELGGRARRARRRRGAGALAALGLGDRAAARASPWAATTRSCARTPLVNGYGAKACSRGWSPAGSRRRALPRRHRSRRRGPRRCVIRRGAADAGGRALRRLAGS